MSFISRSPTPGIDGAGWTTSWGLGKVANDKLPEKGEELAVNSEVEDEANRVEKSSSPAEEEDEDEDEDDEKGEAAKFVSG
jgi:hypothetical protein